MMTQKNTSQQYPLMMISGWKNLFQRGICVYMKIHNMICALTHAHTFLNQLHLALEEAPQYMDLHDIFEFPDVMVSADDDVPSLEDILRL